MIKKYFTSFMRAGWLLALLMATHFYAGAQTVHEIPNNQADTLERFIENVENWNPGDTIMLVNSGEYVVRGTIDIFQDVTIMGDPELSTRPLVIFYDNGFRPKEDSINVTIKGINFDGLNPTNGNTAPYILRFDQAQFYNYKNIVIEDVEAYNFDGGIQLYKNEWTHYDTVIVKNVFWHDFTGEGSGEVFNLRHNSIGYLEISNSTFANLERNFISNPYFSKPEDGRTEVIEQHIVIDHCTFYMPMNEALLQINDPNDESVTVTFTNNILSTLKNAENNRPFRINELAGDITIHNNAFFEFASSRDEGAYNVDAVGALPNVDVQNAYSDDPGFRNAEEYNFLLPLGSDYLTAGTDGGALGDPRWLPTEGVTIRPLAKEPAPDTEVQMTADVSFPGEEDVTVTWSVLNNLNGTEGAASIDAATGVLTPEAAGDIQVIATSNFNTDFADTLDVTIEEKVLVSEIILSGRDIEGDETNEINKEQSLTMFAQVLPGNAHDKSITWSIDNDEIAAIDEDGVLTTTGGGDLTITASANDGSEVTATWEVAIKVDVAAVEITYEGDTTVVVGETLQLTAAVSPEDATNGNVIWSVDDENIATVSEDGLVTAVAAGIVTVTAASEENEFIIDTQQIEVEAPLSVRPEKVSIARVYPNPVTDKFIIEAPSVVEVSILNMAGSVISSRKVEGVDAINISGLRSGVYFARISARDQVQVIKIIKL